MSRKVEWMRRLPIIIGVILAVLVAVGIWLLKDLFQKPIQAKKQVQMVTVVQPPPPPPPEQPEEKIEEPEPEPEPEPTPDESNEPPADELDGAGAEGQDSFGLRRGSGRPGGHLGGGGGNSVIFYGQQIEKGLIGALEKSLRDTAAKKFGYSVIVNIWVTSDGTANRFELANSSGKSDVDAVLRSALAGLSYRLDRPPPVNMPQPIKVRFTSRI